ncbi:MAG TPA: ABC transporter ATP-binding protein [Drouetiella sp.]
MDSFTKRNPIGFLIKSGWQYAGPHRWMFPACVVIFASAQAAQLAEPYVMAQLLNTVQQHTRTMDALVHEICKTLAIYFVLQITFWVFHGPGRYLDMYLGFQIKLNYRTTLFRMITSLPLAWHRQHHSGESIDKINRAANSLGAYFEDSFVVHYMVVNLIGAHVMLCCFLPAAGFAALTITVVAVLLEIWFSSFLADMWETLNTCENHVAAAVHDYVTNIESVIMLRLENRTTAEVARRMLSQISLYTKTVTINEFKWFLNTVLIASMTVIVLGYYAWATLSSGHELMGGTFLALFEYLRRIGQSYGEFAMVYGRAVRQATNVESANTIVRDAMGYARDEQEHSLPRGWQTVRVQNLNFAYEDAEHGKKHLSNVTIELSQGRSIALVGESGCGKSTLLSLLRGLRNPDHCDVICDDKIMPFGLKHMADATTLLPQDPQLFNDTIERNVTFGLDAPANALTEAVELARFSPVLARLPKGIETDIAEKGVNLSGGEKQRLALARGLFFAQGSQIVLFDEPTSSVDTYNERLIYTNVLREFKEKCLVSSIHKLHLLDLFDHVYVMENGKVVESGNFYELLEQGGILAKMWRHYQVGTEGGREVEQNLSAPSQARSEEITHVAVLT